MYQFIPWQEKSSIQHCGVFSEQFMQGSVLPLVACIAYLIFAICSEWFFLFFYIFVLQKFCSWILSFLQKMFVHNLFPQKLLTNISFGRVSPFFPQPQCHPHFLLFLTIPLFAFLWWQRFLLSRISPTPYSSNKTDWTEPQCSSGSRILNQGQYWSWYRRYFQDEFWGEWIHCSKETAIIREASIFQTAEFVLKRSFVLETRNIAYHNTYQQYLPNIVHWMCC